MCGTPDNLNTNFRQYRLKGTAESAKDKGVGTVVHVTVKECFYTLDELCMNAFMQSTNTTQNCFHDDL